MVDRADIGGWLSGPKDALAQQGIDLGFRGQRLGLPPEGPGSVAGFGKRIVALALDWFACMLIVRLAFPSLAVVDSANTGGSAGNGGFSLAVLGTFGVEVALLTWLGGGSFGQRIMGLTVPKINGEPLGLWRSVVRTALLCLAVPALIWDRDGRGLHDRAVGSVVVRQR